MQCTGGYVYVSETDTFYQVKPNTDQINQADIIYLEFAIPTLNELKELLHQNIIFQSILHGITRGHPTYTPYLAAILCGTAIVLAYTRGILTHTDLPYPEGGELEELKSELECHKQKYILRVAHELSQILMPFTIRERVLSGVGIVQSWRRQNIHELAQEINSLLSKWG